MKVKIFSKELSPRRNIWLKAIEAVHGNLEEEINDWLSAHGDSTIKQIEQTQSGGGLESAKVIVSVWYE